MELTKNGTTLLDAEDFRRLGIRPNECRLTVIRRAAAKSARLLAQEQLSSPNPKTELQLSRVATSTYRLMDPRKRQDVYQRAYIGRILPNVLQWAGRTSFLAGGSAKSPTTPQTPFNSSASSDADLADALELSPTVESAIDQSDLWTRSLNPEDLIRSGGYRRRSRWVRRQLLRPMTVLALMALLTGASYWLASWSSQQNRLTVRRDDATSAATIAAPQTRPDLASVDLPSVDVPSVDVPSVDVPSVDLPSVDLPSVDVPSAATDPTAVASVDSQHDDTRDDGPPIGIAIPIPSPVTPGPAVEPSVAALAPLPDSKSPESADVLPTQPDEIPTPEPLDRVADTDGPGLDVLAIREVNVIVSDVRDYLFDLVKPLVELEEPLLAANDPEAIDATDRGAAADMPSETPRADMPTATEIATKLPQSPALHSVPQPAEVALVREQWAVSEPVFVRGIESGEAESVMGRIDEKIGRLEIGTAEHWAAHLMSAEIAWTVETRSKVESRLQSLAKLYRTDVEPLLVNSFLGAIELAKLPETHEHLLAAGLQLSERRLVAESFGDCQTVVDAARPSAELLEDESAIASLDQLTESVSQMSRVAASISDVVNDGELFETATDEKTGIAGRYYCLMLRRWEAGLPWLVEASDPRIAGLASAELALTADASADDLSELAERWLAVASRTSGRASQSMQLHSIDLLRRAISESAGLKKLEIERAIEEIERSLPRFVLQPAANDTVAKDEPMAVTPAILPVLTKEANTGLVGRVRSQGQDVGVQLIYELGVPMTSVVIEQIRERLRPELEGFVIEFQGVFELIEPATVRVDFAQVTEGTQQIWINQTSLDLDQAIVSLDAGEHEIRWSIEADAMSPVFLKVQEAESQRDIEIAQPATSLDGQLPTQLTVKMVRRSQ